MAPPPRTALVVAAFAAVYIIWGTTYLAIAFVIDTLPSLLAMGTRYVAAGAALWMIAPGSWRTRPTRRDWAWAFVLGGLLLLAGNGIVAIVQGKMPSGVTALIITMVPLWMVLVEWATGGGRPQPLSVLGILLGFGGVALLAGESGGWKGGEVDLWYVAALLFGTLCWALGSILSRRGGIQLPLLRSVALQMMAGSILLVVASALRGEWSDLHLENAATKSLLAWFYLVTFGSIVAFSAYSWLLTVRPSAMVSTYAFVNPIVAVLLGAWFLDEPLGPRTVLAGALIVGAVAIVIYAKARKTAAASTAGAPSK